MNIISYAQNFEDVILWRALSKIETGFYIDVGANDPTTDSVTKLFYDSGWTGINIEPVEEYLNKLNICRPRDINIGSAIGNEIGQLKLYNIPQTGLTTGDPEIANHHIKSGWQIEEILVPITTLTQICETHVSTQIHFLKIDVEGFETKVLEGFDLTKWRPWVIVIESTVPLSSELNHNLWEKILLSKNYTFAYFDGLNRFYYSNEHAELKQFFMTPPNYFDHFTLASQNTLQVENQSLKKIHSELEIKLSESNQKLEAITSDLTQSKQQEITLNHNIEHWWSVANGLNLELVRIKKSKSWRFTHPLRLLNKKLNPICLIKNYWIRLKQKIKIALIHTDLYLQRHPKLRTKLIKFISLSPELLNIATKIMTRNTHTAYSDAITKKHITHYEHLGSEERKIFNDLSLLVSRNHPKSK